ncbi:MAG: hypothetical protein VB099_17595 [Candidatus Limiplasma sp.]|nr:hypothetical protein [Candidatus Limiplasma sp.]
MHQRVMALILTIAILIGMSATATANATPFSVDDMKISLAPGYSIFRGTWIAKSRDSAFLLLGSENENVMKVAIASQSSGKQYEITALSEKIITYEEYCIGAIQLLDKWDDGCPYFWYVAKGYKDVYISVKADDEDDWKVKYAYITYYKEDIEFSYYTTDTPNEIIVYDTISPQICWPVEISLSLDHFDIVAVENACTLALQYLNDFQKNHRFGDQDETYRIIW